MKRGITVLFLLLLAVCSTTGAFAQNESDFNVRTLDGWIVIEPVTKFV